MARLDFNTLAERLINEKARWRARQTPQSKMNDAEKRAMLGVTIDKVALATAMAPRLANAAVANFAPAVDWRNRNGNHVTMVKHQQTCGSCVSFATAATVESMVSIEKGQLFDLSESDLHFCSSHGANCGGWWPDQAYAEIKDRGVVSELIYPCMDSFDKPPVFDSNNPSVWKPHCLQIGNRNELAVKVTTTSTLVSMVDRKN